MVTLLKVAVSRSGLQRGMLRGEWSGEGGASVAAVPMARLSRDTDNLCLAQCRHRTGQEKRGQQTLIFFCQFYCCVLILLPCLPA